MQSRFPFFFCFFLRCRVFSFLFFFCFAKLLESRKESLRSLREHKRTDREVACNIPWVIPWYKESRAGMRLSPTAIAPGSLDWSRDIERGVRSSTQVTLIRCLLPCSNSHPGVLYSIMAVDGFSRGDLVPHCNEGNAKSRALHTKCMKADAQSQLWLLRHLRLLLP